LHIAWTGELVIFKILTRDKYFIHRFVVRRRALKEDSVWFASQIYKICWNKMFSPFCQQLILRKARGWQLKVFSCSKPIGARRFLTLLWVLDWLVSATIFSLLCYRSNVYDSEQETAVLINLYWFSRNSTCFTPFA
jgi:hypothetical protein